MSFISANKYKHLENDSAIVQAEGAVTNIFTNSNFYTSEAYKKLGAQFDIHIYDVGNVLLAGENLTAVFGAINDSKVKMRAANVMRRDEKTPVTLGDGIEIDFQNPVM